MGFTQTTNKLKSTFIFFMRQNQFDCIAYDWVLPKYQWPSKYEGENDDEIKPVEVPYYFPPGKWTSSSFFLSLLSKSHYGSKYSKTTKARNLKFGQMISLFMNLCVSIFGGAMSRGLGQMHLKACLHCA